MTLVREIRAMGHGDHVCLIYDRFEDQVAALAPILHDGIERGECCVYVCDDNTVADVSRSLRTAGLDVDALIERGALRLLTKREAYLGGDGFEPEAMVGKLRAMEAEALAGGFTGLRITGEMTWALGEDVDCQRVMEYEAIVNRHFPASRSLGVCQYNRERFPADVIDRVLRTHPTVVMDGHVLPNPYFEPATAASKGGDAAARVEWKLAHLQHARAAAVHLQRASDGRAAEVAIAEPLERRRANALLAAQKRSLELVVSGAPLADVLRHLVTTVEEQAGGCVAASILLLDDDRRLRNGASPSLPEHYLRAIDGLPADPAFGTCCAAAALGCVIVTPDFATAPSWKGWSHLPLSLGFRGAWSMPILAHDGAVLGTFGTYFREIREPTAVEREVVEVLARTASIAIERGRAEAALREREAFNRRLLESSGDCIKLLSLDGRLLAMNRAGQHLMELEDLEALLGSAWLAFWEGEHLGHAQRALEAALRSGEGRFQGECLTGRGTRRWWDVVITQVPDAEGRPFRLLCISRDITEQKSTEGELRRAKEAAEAANLAKSQFLAIMSHELRTPLTGIIGYADLVASDIWGEVNAEQREHIARIKSGAWHLVSVIEEILTFSRLEAGKEEVRSQRVELVRLVRESAALLEPQAAAKGIELRVCLPEASREVETDQGKLRQILLNLLGNAVKFTDAGLVELSLDLRERHARFLVRDTGPGVPGDQHERIFEPFTQVDQSHTRTKGGTGLGLTVCRRLARLLGGDVELLESESGKGSVFALHLPLVATAPAETDGDDRIGPEAIR